MITYRWLTRHGACHEARTKWQKRQLTALKDVDCLRLLIREKRYDWAYWLMVKIMTCRVRPMAYPQYVAYAIYAAKQALPCYESGHPNDVRFRRAIAAAQRCHAHPTAATRRKALSVSEDAFAAADSANFLVFDPKEGAAPSAAYSAARCAWSAAEHDVGEAMGAVECAWCAAECLGKTDMQQRILHYGLRLLEKPTHECEERK